MLEILCKDNLTVSRDVPFRTKKIRKFQVATKSKWNNGYFERFALQLSNIKIYRLKKASDVRASPHALIQVKLIEQKH